VLQSALVRLVLFTLLLFSACVVPKQEHPAPVQPSKPPESARLQLISHRIEHITDENSVINGEIQNIGRVRVEYVNIHATVYDRSGRVLTNGNALASVKPLSPGGISSFEVWVSNVPSAANYRLYCTDERDREIPC
jgi:hypothetical protein